MRAAAFCGVDRLANRRRRVRHGFHFVDIGAAGSRTGLFVRVVGEEEVFDCVGDSSPAGLDDVGAGPYGGPIAHAVRAGDQDADGGAGALVAVEDAHLVVQKVQAIQLGEVTLNRLTQRQHERVDGTVAFGHFVVDLIAYFDLDGRLGRKPAAGPVCDRYRVVDQRETGSVPLPGATQHEVDAGFGAFEFEADVLHFLDLLEDGAFFFARQTLDAKLVRLDGDIVLATQFADEHAGLVANLLRVDVLVAVDVFEDGVDVRAALMCEGALADKWLVRVGAQVGQFVDEVAEVGQVGKLLRRHEVVAHFELHVGDDANQVGVAAALAVAVDGALYVGTTVSDRLQRVCNASVAVVVGVDAEGDASGARQYLIDCVHYLGYFPGECAAVGVTEDDAVGAAGNCPFEGSQRVFGVLLVAVEEMLGIVNHFASVAGEIGYGLANHAQILCGRRLKDVAHVQIPAFAEEGDNRRVGLKQQLNLLVVCRVSVPFAGRAEGCQTGVLQVQFASGAFEEFHIFGIGTGPAALNVVNAKLI